MTTFRFSLFLIFFLLVLPAAFAQQVEPTSEIKLYQQLKRFELSGGVAQVKNLTLKRDRAQMTFDGTFYFESPIDGKVRGAVFQGKGTFRAEPPPGETERDNVRRLLKADLVESDFQTAVLRFSDDTFDIIGGNIAREAVPAQVVKLASEFEPRQLKETGANISARLTISILNQEKPGFFIAQFDGGKRDRFSFLLDYQCRIPTSHFDINGGEKGLIFSYRANLLGNDIWMAFYSLENYKKGNVEYSDINDLVAVRNYAMEVDVRDPGKVIRLKVRMDIEALTGGLRAVPMTINNNLGERDNQRLKKALRLKSSRLADGTTLETVQEDWEAGLTFFLPAVQAAHNKFSVVMELEGDSLFESEFISSCYYPISSVGWYPRHGYLERSTYDITFLHRKDHRVASTGLRVREESVPESKSEMITEWKMDTPVSLVGFGVGRLERHQNVRKLKEGDLPIEFYSVPGSVLAIKEDFVLAELGNTVEYFSTIFGKYPYPKFGAVYHPRGYGQGLASMLLLPSSDRASKYTYSFIAHETSHQWWGNIVAWRSYRDQWLSEGFAEYSGILYTGLRDKKESQKELIERSRDSLSKPPQTEIGAGKGRLADVGPLILGHRLNTRETLGAYSTLIYNKGALVLRMLHFLFTDPQTGDGQAFFDMMSDFVHRYENGSATTEGFIAVANEHFPRSPIGKRLKVKDLNWFFRQWVYRAELPSYQFSYTLEKQPDGSMLLHGVIEQSGVSDDWFMPLPLVMRYGKDGFARGLVFAAGPKSTIDIKIPGRPDDVQLDPELWVLSEKTSTRK